jgi:hypothetical protein
VSRRCHVHKSAVLAGVELDVCSAVEPVWVDDSFDHEFGTQRQSHVEPGTISPVEADGSVREAVERELEARGRRCRRNRGYKKHVRQLTRTVLKRLAALDPEEFWTSRDLERALDGAQPDDRDEDFGCRKRRRRPWRTFRA